MNAATYVGLKDELQKIAGLGLHGGAELAGLGMLAAPSAGHLMGKDMSEKNKSRMELAGLGTLAAPVVHSAFSKPKIPGAIKSVAKGVGKKLIKKGSIADSALFIFKKAMPVRPGLGTAAAGMLNAGAKAAKNVVKPAAKMLGNPQRAAMLGHFTPPSQVNMSRAISL